MLLFMFMLRVKSIYLAHACHAYAGEFNQSTTLSIKIVTGRVMLLNKITATGWNKRKEQKIEKNERKKKKIQSLREII